jgi:hypothetical protein
VVKLVPAGGLAIAEEPAGRAYLDVSDAEAGRHPGVQRERATEPI